MALMAIEAWLIFDGGVTERASYIVTSHKLEYGRATGEIVFYHDGVACNNSYMYNAVNDCLNTIFTEDPNTPVDLEIDQAGFALFDMTASLAAKSPELVGLQTLTDTRVPTGYGATFFTSFVTTAYTLFGAVTNNNGTITLPLGNPLVYKKIE